MIFAYFKEGDAVHLTELQIGQPIPPHIIWLDMKSPEDAELDFIEQNFNITLPTKTEVWKNHVLNRLYIEDGISYMTAALIRKVDSPHPETTAITFILSPNFMLTVRETEPTSFRNFSERLMKHPRDFCSSNHMLLGLMEEVISRVAYNSELVVDTLDELSHSIFGEEITGDKTKSASHKMKVALKKLGAAADLNSKINESVHSIQRLLIFFKQIVSQDVHVDNNIDVLIADANALTIQSGFLSDKLTFQLDTLLGLINVEQNLIIKMFSVVAVFFLPPTLVSSIYGMNFEFMPELQWQLGYPIALGIMLFSILVPYFYFKKRGWL